MQADNRETVTSRVRCATVAVGIVGVALLATAGSLAAAPKPGVGPKGLTSAHLCSLVTAAQAKALLIGQEPVGGAGASHGNPQSNLGQAGCTWADQSGGNVSISIATSSRTPANPCASITGGTKIRKAGWVGCWVKTSGLYAYEGIYSLDITGNLGTSIPAALLPAGETATTSVFKKLHA
jgi:hypothetical protein